MFVRLCAVMSIVAVSAGAAPAADSPLDEAEWRRLTDGATVHYSKNGRPAGREYYVPNESFTVFVDPSGACYEGAWAFTEGRFCFLYAESFQCFAHLKRGDRLVSRSDVSGREQVIDRITRNEPLSCTR